MSEKTWFEKDFAELEQTLEFRLEYKILEITDEICSVMESKDINRAELARRLGKTKSFVSRILNGNSNFTLRTMLEFADALDEELYVSLRRTPFQTVFVTAHPRETTAMTSESFGREPAWKTLAA